MIETRLRRPQALPGSVEQGSGRLTCRVTRVEALPRGPWQGVADALLWDA
jgi:hypothetical protein